MRRGDLPVEGHNKVSYRPSEDLLTRHYKNVAWRRGRDAPQRRHCELCLVLAGGVVERY